MSVLVALLGLVAVILLIVWIIAFVVVHVVFWAIHLLIVGAVLVALIALWNLLTGKRGLTGKRRLI